MKRTNHRTPDRASARLATQDLGSVALAASLALLLSAAGAAAQTPPARGLIVARVGVPGMGGFSGDGGPAASAELDHPANLGFGPDGVLYVADSYNARLRRVSRDGTITTVAGGGTIRPATNGSVATQVAFAGRGNAIRGAAADRVGNLYFAVTADGLAAGVWRITPGGRLTNLLTKLDLAGGLAIDVYGFLYASDDLGHQIWRVSPDGSQYLLAGRGPAALDPDRGSVGGFAGDNGPATQALLNNPAGLATDQTSNLVIADLQNRRVRRVSANGTIQTVAGNGGTFYMSSPPGDGGPATQSPLNEITGVAVDSAGNLYVAGDVIRRVAPDGTITSLVGDSRHADFAPAVAPIRPLELHATDVAVDASGNLYVNNTATNQVLEILDVAAPGLQSGALFPLAARLGDLNGDGQVTIADAIVSLRIALGTLVPVGDQALVSDVNGDGKVSVADALLILRFALGLTGTFPAAEGVPTGPPGLP